MPNRRRGSSFGPMDVGDTQGTSISTAVSNNKASATRRERERTRARSGNADASSAAPDSARRPARSGAARPRPHMHRSGLARLLLTRTWVLPLVIVGCVYAAYFAYAREDPGHWLNQVVKLSYRRAGTSLYGKGRRDWYFLAFHVVFFTFLREFCMQVALRPIAFVLGLRTKHKINRFLEQAYSMLYYGITGPVGLYIMKYRAPELWYFNTTAFYENFPHRELDVWFKAFYLLQAAFWAQQALVLLLHLEKRRQDFEELVFHHVVTVALIWLSYRFHFHNIGLAVYITMDVSDFFLALSKILNYLESRFVVFFFFTFVAVWVYLRHYLNLVILYSVATEFRTVGPYELNWETQQYKCYISQPITFVLLLMLQLVNIYWLVLVLRIAYRYVRHNIKEDVRSDAEDDEPLEQLEEKVATPEEAH